MWTLAYCYGDAFTLSYGIAGAPYCAITNIKWDYFLISSEVIQVYKKCLNKTNVVKLYETINNLCVVPTHMAT